jgi:hypothetical protein
VQHDCPFIVYGSDAEMSVSFISSLVKTLWGTAGLQGGVTLCYIQMYGTYYRILYELTEEEHSAFKPI